VNRPLPNRPTVRISPAPRREPRFDDERPSRYLSLVIPGEVPLPFAEAAAAEALARNEVTSQRPGTSRPPRQSRSHLGHPAPGVRDLGRGPGRHEILPDPSRFGRYFVQAVLEVLCGRRPAGQLTRHTSPAILTGLTRDQARGGRFESDGRNAVVHSVHVMEPAERVAELAVVVQIGNRFRAIAVRLEAHHNQWRCVRLDVG